MDSACQKIQITVTAKLLPLYIPLPIFADMFSSFLGAAQYVKLYKVKFLEL